MFCLNLRMYDSKTCQGAKVNSTDLNEDLGQVEYLFSDKTGTLTENEMTFKHFALDEFVYTLSEKEIYVLDKNEDINKVTIPEDVNNEKFKRFFEILTLCHNVQLDLTNATNEKYNASSPDELSFITFCQKFVLINLNMKS